LIKSNDLEHGAYEWNAKTIYNTPALVFGSDGNIYKALKSSINKNPISNPDVWEDIITKLSEFIIDIKNKAFPIGGICAWPSLNNFPSFGITWLECDGSFFNPVAYPELYSVLNSNILPDYRGIFLRRIWQTLQ